MKILVVISAVILSACTTDIALIDKLGDAKSSAGVLHMKFSGEHAATAELAGKRYEGNWEHAPCTIESCAKYEKLSAGHTKHSTLYNAELKSDGGATLQCEWVYHMTKLTGTCIDQLHKEYKIEAAK